MPNREWRFMSGQKPGSVSLHPTFEINDAVAAIRAAEMGHGITNALSYMVSDQIRDGKLAPVLDTFTLPPQPVHLVYPHTRLVAAKSRAFIDFAAPRLRSALDRLAWTRQEATPASPSDAFGRKS
jgi:DNA-binding transcriptional LysR family regulator